MKPIIALVSVVTAAVLAGCGGPTDAEQRYKDGVDARADGRLEEAVALYTEAIELDPTIVEAYVDRSSVYGSLGRFDEAVGDATKAIELEPTDENLLALAHAHRANGLAALGRLEEAGADLAKACELGLAEACRPSTIIDP